jgi:hypothetical protein
MKHLAWLLMISGAFYMLQPESPWIIAGAFCSGLLIGCLVTTRTPQPQRAVLRRTPDKMEPPPVRFVRAIDLQGDLFASEWRAATGALRHTDDAPPLVDLGPQRAKNDRRLGQAPRF